MLNYKFLLIRENSKNYSLTKLLMKFAIVLVLLTITSQIKTNPVDFQACMTEGQLSAEHLLNALDGIVTLNPERVITEVSNALDEIQKAQAVCKKAQFIEDGIAVMWADATDGQKACMMQIMPLFMFVPQAIAVMQDPKMSWKEKLLYWSPVVETAEKVMEKCVPASPWPVAK